MTITTARPPVPAGRTDRSYPGTFRPDPDDDRFVSPLERGRRSLVHNRHVPDPARAAVTTPVTTPAPRADGVPTPPAPATRATVPTACASYAVEADLTDTGWTIIGEGTHRMPTPTQENLDVFVDTIARVSRRSVPTRASASVRDQDGRVLLAWVELPPIDPTTPRNGHTG